MGKKDAQRCTLPVDQYRKNIGKQDYKRSKKDLIRSKREADRRKTSTGFRVREDVKHHVIKFSKIVLHIYAQCLKTAHYRQVMCIESTLM